MSDIEKSFNFLHDNVPTWFKNIAEIEEQVVRMQSELAKVPISRSPPMKRKTGSIESIRDLDAIMEEGASSTAQSPYATTRKRKTPSAVSGHASSPKYRSRTMIVVYYDGQIQKSFETLVRAIGTGRNMLRKGKMAAKMEALAELAGSDDDEDDDDDAVMSKIGYRHRVGLSSMRTRAAAMRGPGGMNGGGSRTPVELFDSTDKALEQAQSLCERAAHQSLRDGDCRKELEGVRRHFDEVLEAAKKEVAKFATCKVKEAATKTTTMESASTPMAAPAPVLKPILPDIQPIPNGTAHNTSKTVEIEVDDEEEDDMDFVMPPVRLTSRA